MTSDLEANSFLPRVSRLPTAGISPPVSVHPLRATTSGSTLPTLENDNSTNRPNSVCTPFRQTPSIIPSSLHTHLLQLVRDPRLLHTRSQHGAPSQRHFFPPRDPPDLAPHSGERNPEHATLESAVLTSHVGCQARTCPDRAVASASASHESRLPVIRIGPLP